MKTRYYCTLFDSNYTPHAISLYNSLRKVSPEAIIFAFCMDNNSFQHIKQLELPNLIPIVGKELEIVFNELNEVKKNRSIVEYYYTCSPLICIYIFDKFSEVQELTYLDADLYFFSNPEPLFEEMGSNSVAIIGHRFSFLTRRNKIYGNYNVGWITFKKDVNGIKCLTEWGRDCIRWCFQKLEDGKYADQKYLDYWKFKYPGVIELLNVGANLAIWNLGNYKLSVFEDDIYVDESKLIFYHFANLKQINTYTFQTDLSRVFISCKGILKEYIYVPYIKELTNNTNCNNLIKAKLESNSFGFNLVLKRLTRKVRQFIFKDLIEII